MGSISEATFHGYIATTRDALLIFEATRRGILPKITRRLREDERKLIKSGTVFVFDERESGIKRWTDGLLWSPSRILWNFLVYRQIDRKAVKPDLDQPAFATSQPGFPLPSAPAEASSSNAGSTSTARAQLASQLSSNSLSEAGIIGDGMAYGGTSSGGVSSTVTVYEGPGGNMGAQFASLPGAAPGQAVGMVGATSPSSSMRRHNDFERSLVGSLTNSYPFLRNGLCKKTISIQVEGSTQHLISYYAVDDVRAGRLRTPASLPEIAALSISPIFLNKSNFRNPPQIEVGPDGIPRYRGDAIETTSSRIPGHLSGSEGNSSGSDSRDAKSLSSPGSAMMLYSPSMGAENPYMDPYYRHPHQIGGSGALTHSASAGNVYASGPSHRRSSDAQLRRSGSRYEPYTVAGANYAYSAGGSPYPSPSGTPYYQSSSNPGSSASGRKSSNASATARNWDLFGASTTAHYSGGHGIADDAAVVASGQTEPAHPYESMANSPFYGAGPNGAGEMHPSAQQDPQLPNTAPPYSLRLPLPYQSDALPSGSMIKSEPTTSLGSSIFHFGRPYRGSWDSNQPQPHPDTFMSDGPQPPPPPATSQGLTSHAIYSHAVVGGPSRTSAEDVQPSPPPTSSSYSSHHSFVSHINMHPPIPHSAGTVDANFRGRGHADSLMGVLDDKRRSTGGMGSSYHMPPPSAPATRWQPLHGDVADHAGGLPPNASSGGDGNLEDTQDASTFHMGTEARSHHPSWPPHSGSEGPMVKGENLWDVVNGSLQHRTDSTEPQSSAVSELQQAAVRQDGADGGLEKVVLTKPSM